MKKLLLIIYLLFLSCDSSDIFGTGEHDATNLDYYDHLSRGWQAIFDKDYDLAKSDFYQATIDSLVVNKNSAYVGLGWSATFSANKFFSSEDCFASDEIECVDVINNLRLDASEYFDLATQSCLNTLGETLPGWDNTEVGCSDESYSFSNISLAEDEYIECGNNYINCFEEFAKDLEIGLLYLELLEFDMLDYDLSISENLLVLQAIIDKIEQFLFDYSDYDIASNKPPYLSTFNFNYQDITVLLAQLLLRVGNDCAAEYYLRDNEVCEPYTLGSDIVYSVFSRSGNVIENDCGLLTEVKFATGNSVNITDFIFHDINDNIINITYHDNDPNDEITDGCNLPFNSISYANSSGVDHIIYNIPENIKQFNVEFDRDIIELSGDLYDNGFEYIHGCYDSGIDNTTSDDDECRCDDVDVILILQCIQSNL